MADLDWSKLGLPWFFERDDPRYVPDPNPMGERQLTRELQIAVIVGEASPEQAQAELDAYLDEYPEARLR